MKFINLLVKREEIKNSLKDISSRFPLACIISFLVTIWFYIMIAWVSHNTEEIIWKAIMSGVITFFLSVGVTLYLESKNDLQKYSLLWQGLSLVFWILFYSFLSSDLWGEDIIFFILTLFWVTSLLFSAPYLQYISSWAYKELSYYIYFYRISTVLFMAGVVGSALALWGSLAIMAVTVLFDLWYSIGGDLYGYWISFALALATPLFALSEVPKKSDFEAKTYSWNVFFEFLIRYIAIPFIYVYFIILYAYTIKVLLNFSDWPKGEVSWMVIWFSLFWYAIYMFSYIFENTKASQSYALIEVFRKYFPYAVLPQTAMLFYAIGLRIWQYDLTVNRYFVVVFGLWLLVTSLYLILSKAKSLLYVPTLLTLFTLLVSLWPWSVYNLPLMRQTERLKNNLIEANILQDGTIVPLTDARDIDEKLSGQIYDGIDYICDFDNCRAVKEIFPKIYEELLERDKKDFEARKWNYSYYNKNSDIEYSEPGKWEIIRYVTDKIKVQRYNDYWYQADTKYLYSRGNMYPLDISGYDLIDNFSTYNIQEKYADINIEEIYTALWEVSSNELSSENNSFDVETENFIWKIIVQSATIALNESANDRRSLGWFILIKNK